MLTGEKIVLRKATPNDRPFVYEWLCRSDLTPSMMGPPHFPDHPVPTWEGFVEDYRLHYFDDSQPHEGRCFIIAADGKDIGVICYNRLRSDGTTDLDIWLKSESECGKGRGSDALILLSKHLNREFGIICIAISPSARNNRAIAAYKKAGFRQVDETQAHHYVKLEEMEFEDNVVLIKQNPSTV